MKRKNLIYVCALLVGLFAYSCKPSDSKIQTEIETALHISGVNVDVKDGVATLSGLVESAELKAEAENLIRTIKGVKSITNNIEIEKAAEPEINSDNALQNIITTAFSSQGFTGINVAIYDGEVTLTGDANRKDLEKIMQIANEAQPKKVINQLNLK